MQSNFKNIHKPIIFGDAVERRPIVIVWQISLSYDISEENLKIPDLIIPQNTAIVTSGVN